MKRLRALALTAPLLTSCGLLPPEPLVLYDGPARPLAEVAVVGHASGNAYIVSIDGAKPDALSNRVLLGIQVLPGSHTIVIGLRKYVTGLSPTQVSFATSEKPMTRELAAGHTYIPRAQLAGSQNVLFWLEDAGTGYKQDCLTNGPGGNFASSECSGVPASAPPPS
jgi:hypothetical protein